MTILLATIATFILALLTVFQFALICGAPIGRFAWGGQHTVLPAKLRIGSIVAIVLYAIFAVFILSKSGVINVISDPTILRIGMWVFTGYFALGIFMNAISRSKPERIVMVPVCVVLATLFLLVTLM